MPSISDYGFTQYLRKEPFNQPRNGDAQTYPPTVAADEVVNPNASLLPNSIPGSAISETPPSSLASGPMRSARVLLEVVPGAGDVWFAAGKTDFSTSGTGFILGIDDSDGDTPKFYLGDTTNYMYWNSTDGLVVSGSLVAGEIHIPDQDSTLDSFHVDGDGNAWWGATESLWLADNENARAYVLSDGFAVFQDIRARGSLYGATFQYDVISAVGGQLLVANADVLDADMTALDSSTMTIRGDTTFAVDDMLHIKAVTSSGVQEEYLRVTDDTSAPTYTVTRDLAGAYAANSNPAWPAGTTVVKEGSSDGSSTFSGGWLRLIGEGSNGPYYSIYDRTGVAYNATTEVARFGNLNGIAGETTETYGIFIGDYDSGNGEYMKYANGVLEVNGSQLANEALFGDGSDGDVTLGAGTTTLSADAYYDTLTIPSGSTLETNGYRVFCRTLLDKQSGGVIRRNGAAGSNGSNGGDGVSATSTQGPGGAGGSGGAALADGTLPGAPAGQAGESGGAGGFSNSAGSNGTNGTNGAAGSNADKPMVDTAVAGVAGANGGGTSGGTGGTGGTAGAAGTDSDAIINGFKIYTSAFMLFDPQDQKWYNTSPQNGQTGGSGGGASDANADPGVRGAGGGGGGAGGGGSNAGTIQIFARRLNIEGTGEIQAVGGDGGNGGDGGDGDDYTTGGAGGGGGAGSGGPGGCGGIIILVYSKKTGSGTTDVSGGTGGAAGTVGTGVASGGSFTAQDGDAGTAGINGANGQLIELQV